MRTQLIPFQSIGLCFSGGGYRATFFSLGVLSYLNRISYEGDALLNRVEAISAVSGGSLLAMAYAKAVQSENYNFNKFYREFYECFEPDKDKLLENAVEKLENRVLWKKYPHKKRSLINAFALAYADMPFFQGQFGMFKNIKSSNLKHVCFNATEFSFGRAFRFQNIGTFGNGNLSCDELNQLSSKIELSDIVASSSCFPIGFEPLVFPDDYIRNRKDTDYKNLKRLENFTKGIGVMDGGIVDNQAIGSMVNISKSKHRDRILDLIIVNDVGNSEMEAWLPENSKGTSRISVKEKANTFMKYLSVHWSFLTILFSGIVLMLINSLEIITGQAWPSLYVIGGVLTGIGLSLSLAGGVIAYLKSDALAKLKVIFENNVPGSLLTEIKSFQKLNTDLVKRMLIERATSGAKMIDDVFLKQIRYLNYQLFYSSENLENRRISSVIGGLNGAKKTHLEIKRPQKRLKAVALTASKAPTSLWWTEEDRKVDRMNSLIACGQFTSCYNLMKYILELKSCGISNPEIDKMYNVLKEDWAKFNENPLFTLE
ncbi:patatin-like phospholipase family protein [Marinifilum sp. RC60d5]|uniref:patatin-like phospholipase family protein n=1 Tax=Marinifilum sp. RC60d5 TaxID=3458414 RepID=UPI004036F87F